MENIPFSSPDEEDKKPSSIFEFFNDDDDDDEKDPKSKNNKKTSKTKRNVFFGKETTEESTENSEKKPSIFGDAGKGIFYGVIKSSEKQPEEDKSEKSVHEVEGDDLVEEKSEEFRESIQDDSENITNEFAEIVDTKHSDAVNKLENSPDEDNEINIADTTFLSSVGSKIVEGIQPENAIDEARQESIKAVEAQDSNNEDVVADLETPDSIEEQQVVDVYAPQPEEDDEAIDPQTQTTSRAASRQTTTPQPQPVIPTPTHNNIAPPTLTPINNIPGYPGNIAPQPTPNQNRSNFNVQRNQNLSPDDPEVRRMNSLYYRDGRRGGLLLGGALGYLFGRRRGRIKTEKKLEPVINKKETEIGKLKKDLERSEQEVRKVASEHLPNSPEAVNVVPAHTLEQRRQEQHDREEKFAESLSDEAIITKAKSTPDRIVDQMPTQEHTAEKAGDIKTEVTAIARDAEKNLNKQTSREKVAEIASMTVPELLVIADKIQVESTSLRRIYENRRIDAVNLRHVVKEYVSGGNYEKTLRQSIASVELQQELKNELKSYDRENAEISKDSTQDRLKNKVFEDSTAPVGVNLPIQNDKAENSGQQPTIIHPQSQPQQALKQGASEDNNNSDSSVSISVAIIAGIAVGIVLMAAILFYNSGG